MAEKISKRITLSVIMITLAGQLAWGVEKQFFTKKRKRSKIFQRFYSKKNSKRTKQNLLKDNKETKL